MAQKKYRKSITGQPLEQPPAINDLLTVIQSLGDSRELAAFLGDLCSPAELKSLADRWKIARLLNEDLSYRKIAETTGVSTTTISRVARALMYGNGYQQALLREKEQKGSRKDESRSS